METLITILLIATMTLTGCSSSTSKGDAHNHDTKEAVEEKLTNCLYCDEDGKVQELFNYPSYYEVKKGTYHEDCYRKLLDEKRPDDNSEGYEMVVCTNCTEYGESIKDWVAYGHYETECTSCKGKLEIKKFATYEDFLMRNEKQKEEVVETPKEESNSNSKPEYNSCRKCQISNASVTYHDGVHGYYAGGYYCDNCFAEVYDTYLYYLEQEKLVEQTCYYCGDIARNRPIEFYEGNNFVKSGYYHGNCYATLYDSAERADNEFQAEFATVFCPSCGYESGEMGQEYLHNHGDTICPQCGNRMREHTIDDLN